jgi:hypothetical protein
MADPTSTAPKKKKAKAQPAAAAPVPTAGGDAGLLTAWRTWALAGLVLVGGVVAWKLLGSSYKGDVETICNGEKGSGFTVAKDMSKVTQYVRSHLATPEGNELFSTLSDAKLVDRAKRLETEASTLKIGSCPMVAAYQQVAAEGDYRADVQHLCSTVTFPKLSEQDDDARLARLEEWIDKSAKSPRTKELAEPLRQGTPADRAKLLRDTGNKIDVFTCDVAKVVESPIAPHPKGLPQVRPFAEPQVNGALPVEALAKGLVDVTPAMNECYRKALDGKPDLQGKLAVKLKIDPTGKVTGAIPADADIVDKEATMCILAALRTMKLPANPGPMVTALVPLELTLSGNAPAGGATAPGASASGAPSAPSARPAPSTKPGASAPPAPPTKP